MTLINYRVIIRTFGFVELDKLKLASHQHQENVNQLLEEGKLGRIYNYYESKCSIKSALKHYFEVLIKKCDMHMEIHDSFYDSFVINCGTIDNYNIVSDVKKKIKSLNVFALNDYIIDENINNINNVNNVNDINNIKDILLVLSPTDNMRPYILKYYGCEKYFILTKNLNFHQIKAFMKTHGIRISRKSKVYINNKKIIDYNRIPINIYFGSSDINTLKIISNEKSNSEHCRNKKNDVIVSGKIIIEKEYSNN